MMVLAAVGLCATAARADEQLAQYVINKNWQEGQRHYEQAILEAFSQGEQPRYRQVLDLYRGYSVCHYFPYMAQRTLSETEQKQLTNWLWRNAELTYKLMLAFDEQDDPARAFEVLLQLLKEDASGVKRRAQMAIAYAVVWDNRRASRLTLEDSWDFFTDSDTELTYRVHALPYQLSKYVIDLGRSEEDLEWAQDKYAGEDDIGRVYDRIWKDKYDRDAFYEGAQPEIAGYENTFENIYEYGGVCIHAAQFAAGIGKATGVPSVIITGSSQTGVGHAWVGYVRRSGRPAPLKWDRDSGRVGETDSIVGEVRDPQTGRMLPEHELDLAILALAESESDRMEADTWLAVGRILARAGRTAEAQWALEESIDTALCSKDQWQAYAELVRQGAVKGGDTVRMATRVANKLEDWPGLAVDAFEAVVLASGSIDDDTKIELADDLEDDFHRNDYVRARMALLKGRVKELADEKEEAVEIYAEAVSDALETSLGLTVLDNAGRLYVEMQELEEAIDLHEDAWDDVDEPRREHAYVQFTTWFQVGLRLAALHAAAGDNDEQMDVIEELVRETDAEDEEEDAMEARLSKTGYGAVNQSRAPQPLR